MGEVVNFHGDKTHEYFCKKLEYSLWSVLRVVRHLLLTGFDIELKAQLRPANMKVSVPDDGDIHATYLGKETTVFAVKQLRHKVWAEMHEWNKYGILICKVDHHKPYVRRYYILDEDMDVAWVFLVKNNWHAVTRHMVRDDTTGKQVECYFAPVEYFIVVDLK